MLSRLIPSQVKVIASCGVQTTATVSNVPRVKRPIHPPPVRLGFIPDEWFKFFYPKTGVSGPYVFLATLTTYLVSKEWYVLEHEFCNGLSILSLILFVEYKYGAKIGEYLDKEIDKVEDEYNQSKNAAIQNAQDIIDDINKEKWRTEGQLMIFDIRKQNVFIQLEAIYRERLANVYSEVKKRLDYHAQINTIERRIAQKHMVQWITNSVLKAITPEQEKANLLQCIKELEDLSAKA
ncbi:unnamed protein product [Xylocopa violacea]|uniref:ATP synthase subunit b n=1 Tax=Xylocopa violacea TaxID=135666 RepID=A0ABP1P507_XYLVO